MKHYLPSSFESDYTNYLNRFEKCTYYDSDAVATRDTDYYGDLAKFLKCQFKGSFTPPQKNSCPFAIYDEDNKMFFTSDTFGFSALRPKGNAWKSGKNYPYARYLEVQSEEKVRDVKKCEFVAHCIYETRSMGGSFIWPKVYLRNHNKPGYYSIYNYFRGEYGYINDRVDLTLYEIKCFYDVFEERMKFSDFIDSYRKKYRDNILFVYANRRGRSPYTEDEKEEEMKAMFNWLKRFASFDNYIEKFCFTPFTKKEGEEYYILNLDSWQKNECLSVDKNNILNREKITSIGKMDCDRLKNLLSNLVGFTEERSKLMEDIIIKTGAK